MDAGSPNPSATDCNSTLPERDRRSCPRHQPATTSYAVGDTLVSGRVAELNEIIDLSEKGMGVQALWPLPVGHIADFRLDLPHPSAYLEVTGTVIWSSPSGRAGIRFAQIAEKSRRELDAWLSANRAASEIVSEPPAVSGAEESDGELLLCELSVADQLDACRNTDYTALLAALAAVKREVEALAGDHDAALQLIARRAQAFTRASGVAIALAEGEGMTCRATAGPDTPPMGARLQIGSGISGECVRRGALLHCRDSETDSLVDRESCRALRIRSIIAVPIGAPDKVSGLLEAFSPDANSFCSDDEIVLQRLAVIVADAMRRTVPLEGDAAESAGAPVDDEFPVENPADLPIPQFSPSRNGLLVSAAVTVVIAVLWLIGTWNSGRYETSHSAPPRIRAESAAPSMASTSDLEGLRRLAEQGDSTAQFAIGTRYATGQDVPQDYAEALRWFTQAAEQGNVIAQSAVAAYYWAGRGVSPDMAKAYFWSLVARAGGDDTSRSRIAALESRLSQTDIATAQQQAQEWLKQHPVVRKDAASQ